MDPVERALRVGGEREVAKKSEEEAGTIAGEHNSYACVAVDMSFQMPVRECLHVLYGRCRV
jgi:hypothetical protein